MCKHVVLEAVSKTLKGQKVLDSVSVSFEKGKTYGIVGRNGSGKTMLLKAICGFLRPDAGRVLVAGKQLGKECEFAEDVGFLFDSPAFAEDLNGYTNLKLLAAIRNRIDGDMVRQWMERVGLDDRSPKPVAKYSLGMRQRLGIAQALMENPSLIVLDEPLNGIDKAGTEVILHHLMQEKRSGKTMILASHLDDDVHTLCDVVYRMEDGRLIEST